MSRVKKSRKPGVGKREVLSEADKKLITPKAKKPKKKVGKQPGNRQKEALEQKNTTQSSNAPKDPRLGSKKPIDLTPKAEAKATFTSTPKKEKPTPIAAIRMVEPVTSSTSELEDEIYAIEDDSQLQHILALQDSDSDLTEEQVNYFNQKMDRHQELRELLGWDDEDEFDEEELNNNSEDDLWDSLDKTDLSKYE